jgi:quinohemoprotein ethanol dehydrogenase
LDAPQFILDNELANQGAGVYGKCFICHGGGAIAGGMAPDLRASPIPPNKEMFTQVVRAGAKVNMGMPSFPELSDEELLALMHYIRRQARADISSKAAGPH